MPSVYEGAKEGLRSIGHVFLVNAEVIEPQSAFWFTFRFDFVKVKVKFSLVQWPLIQSGWAAIRWLRTRR